jgi:hypothetical protein
MHLLVIDLFSPTRRDPSGIAKAIWDQFAEEPIDLCGKPLTISSVDAGQREMCVYFAGVGDELPDVPLFIRPKSYITAPLAASFQEAWRSFLAPLKGLLQRDKH